MAIMDCMTRFQIHPSALLFPVAAATPFAILGKVKFNRYIGHPIISENTSDYIDELFHYNRGEKLTLHRKYGRTNNIKIQDLI